MKQSYKTKLLALFATSILLIGNARAQNTGSVETTGGIAGLSALSMAAGDTTTSVSETLYIGAGSYRIDGTWNIYSKNVWISPQAVITGTGTLKFFNPAVAGGISSPTSVDGNNIAGFIDVNIELNNASNLNLADLTGPDPAWNDSTGKANFPVGKGFDFAVANGNVVLGNYDMVTAAAATFSNYQPDRFVITNGSGHLVHNNYTGAFTYPVGIAQGDYTPASVNNTLANTVHVLVQDYAASASAEAGTDGINRTWNIYADNAAANSLINLQHNSATNNSSYNDGISFVTQYGATAPNTTGQTNLSQSNWQSNIPGPGTGSGTLTTNGTIPNASERSLTYTALATMASAPEAHYTKSSNQITPLPLDLIDFGGKGNNCSAHLEWRTGNELNMSHFELQKSTGGGIFRQLATINVRGNNSIYTYEDLDASSARQYYRLGMVSLDGKITFSKVLALDIGCDTRTISVYPNPSNSKITVTGINAGNTLYVLDMTGKVISTTIAVNPVQQIDLAALPDGLYLLRIVSGTGQATMVKIVKQ
jgi:hypothetical protein